LKKILKIQIIIFKPYFVLGEEHHRRILTNFYNLKELHLTNAFTEVIDSKYYLDDLMDIFLASEMKTLLRLHLDQNEIWTIRDDLFCSLPALTDLYLANNQLYDINFGFDCIKNLTFLDLSFNKIKRISSATLERIDQVFHQPTNDDADEPANNKIRRINLNHNPFVCDCNLRPMFDWLTTTTTNLYKPDELRCYTGIPERNAGKNMFLKTLA
jgi:hypothetical protein